MLQIARNATGDSWGYLENRRYVLHDRDAKFCDSFRETLRSGGIQPLVLSPRSPNLNAFAERWVRSVKHDCVSKLILFGEGSLRRALTEYIGRYHSERNHQGKRNLLLFPKTNAEENTAPKIDCRERLGGLLRFYYWAAA